MKQSKSPAHKLPLFLCLTASGWGGQQADATLMWMDGGVLRGEYLMRSFGESPSVAAESHLSQILEDSPHQKYSLSAKACLGILKRAERRRKPLPPMLENALLRQATEAQPIASKETASTEQTPPDATEKGGQKEFRTR
jgi:hypothetical protein